MYNFLKDFYRILAAPCGFTRVSTDYNVIPKNLAYPYTKFYQCWFYSQLLEINILKKTFSVLLPFDFR